VRENRRLTVRSTAERGWNGKVLWGARMAQSSSWPLSLTSALDCSGWLMPRPGGLPPENDRDPMYRRQGEPEGR
jgi:hypothetical protein